MLQEANCSTNLGIMRSNDFSYAAHEHSICMKANRMCDMILTLFKTKTLEFKMTIFLTYFRPIVEYAAPVWNPELDVGLTARLEQVQKRFTRKLLWREKLLFDERLKLVSVPTLHTMRKYIDLVIVFKTLHGCLNINPASFGLAFSTLPTRGYSSKVTVGRLLTIYVSRSYNYRIAHIWNFLPMLTKLMSSLDAYKNALKRHFS